MDTHHTDTKNKARHTFLKTFENPIQPITIPHTSVLQNTKDYITQQDLKTIRQESAMNGIKIDSNYINKAQNNPHTNTQDKQLFSKTQKILQHLADLSIFDGETLQKGMKIDLSHSDSKFFELYIGAELHLASAYAHIIDERTFMRKKSPDLHFVRCEAIKRISQDLLKVCVPTKNAFDYRVRSGGVDTRLFYEHPLRICPICVAELCEILSIKHKRTIHTHQIKEEEIIGLLFKNKLKNIVM